MVPALPTPSPSVALTATLHDPDGRYLAALAERRFALGWYQAVYLAVTSATDPRLVEQVAATPGVVVVAGDRQVGVGRRRALQAAAEAGHAAMLACDFDRWLHWVDRFPEELREVPERLARRRPAVWYACLGRTARAFASHPPVQRATEGATNRALSRAVGRRLDATAGACWLSAEGAALVLRESTEPSNATDLEWPALIYRADPARLTALFLEGLEFETASFAAAEVAAAGGLAAWMEREYDQPAVWHARLRLATGSVAALCRVLG
ncbi:MAG: hypothetical protein H0W59_06210 [Chloroflexia bacterium]|nr:hypothetical protein [Chloroflexia bacterium]